MALVYLYARKGQFIIPSIVKTDKGVYLQTSPVEVIGFEQPGLVASKLVHMLSTEAVEVPTPRSSQTAESAVLKELGLKRWDAFEREAKMYTIHVGSGGISLYVTGRRPDGMWKNDPSLNKSFSSSTPLAGVVRDLLTEVLADPEVKPLLLGGLALRSPGADETFES